MNPETNTTKELISIIIPVYNHAEELVKATDSISKQTYQNLEVIIVDDGSEREVNIQVTKSQSQDASFKFQVIHQKNAGAPNARNVGFDKSKGEYVIFWDADVIAEPQMLEKMLNVLNIHPEASYVYSSFYYGKKKMPAQKYDPDVLKERNYIHSTSLIRRSDFPGWDEKIKRFQDWDLWLTMLRNTKKGIFIPEFLFKVIPNKKGISTWLPKIFYRAPFSWMPGINQIVGQYKKAKEVIFNKHNI